ncbi:MAG: hypothetical protein AB2771_19070, partial [Candidatus Thiodiazotropha endolucinida]
TIYYPHNEAIVADIGVQQPVMNKAACLFLMRAHRIGIYDCLRHKRSCQFVSIGMNDALLL